MKKQILVLNSELSGINKYLFSHLENIGWKLTVVNVPYPKIGRWWALITTFHPNISHWKRKFATRLDSVYKTPWVFQQRSKFCSKTIEKLGNKFNLIFQISGMFAPFYDRRTLDIPYVTFNDYTMALSDKYEVWSTSPFNREKWLDLEKKLYENAALNLTSNENAWLSIVNDYAIKEEKVITVGCGVNLEEMEDFPKKYDGKTILFIGIDFERKGGNVLLEAFKKVRKGIPDAKLIIAGPNKQMFNITDIGVEMVGYVRDKEILKNLYKKASIFVMPSLCEPFGLVFLEAMAFKLPCIGTSVDAMSEIIEDGKTGFIIPPNNIDILAEKIIFLLSRPKLMKQMGMAAYEKVSKRFRWPSVVERIDHSLSSICKEIKFNKGN